MTPIEVRDLRFPLASAPRDWHAEGPAVTAFFDQLSVFFPLGESFFVRSVKHFAPQAHGRLREEVDAFCAQEGHHTREHRAYNARLAGFGLPVERLEGLVRFALGFAQRRLSPHRQLAITCALEHFTSLMGEFILGHPACLEGSDPAMTALWRWHAAEESEHRSVAFDLYRATGGGWFTRARAMIVVTLIFWALVVLQQATFMSRRGILFSPREHWRLLRHLFLAPGTLRALVVPYLAYFRPGFHPAERGSLELVEAWKRTLPGPAR
jgi:predicted metal-dependent hydrolase